MCPRHARFNTSLLENTTSSNKREKKTETDKLSPRYLSEKKKKYRTKQSKTLPQAKASPPTSPKKNGPFLFPCEVHMVHSIHFHTFPPKQC